MTTSLPEVSETIQTRSVIYALRRIGVTAADRAKLPLLFDEHHLRVHARLHGHVFPVDITIRKEEADPKRTSVTIRSPEPEVRSLSEAVLRSYRPDNDPDVWTRELRAELGRQREEALHAAGWAPGQLLMPTQAVGLIIREFESTTPDPLQRELWLSPLESVRLGAKDRRRVVMWILDVYHNDVYEDERWRLGEVLRRFAAKRDAEEVTRIVRDPRFGHVRSNLVACLPRLLKHSAGSVIIELLDDAPVRLAALAALGKLKSPDFAPRVEPYLRDGDALIRKEARRALRRMGVTLDAPPRPVHRVPNSTRFGSDLVEWSTNLDLGSFAPLLQSLADWTERGFAATEVLEVFGVFDRMRVNQTRTFAFPITLGRADSTLGIQVFLDDEDSPDVTLWVPRDLIPRLDDWLASTAGSGPGVIDATAS